MKKKVAMIVILFACMLGSMVVLTACGEGQVTKISYLSGNLNYMQYSQTGTLLTDLKVKATFENGKTRIVDRKDLRVATDSVDTSIVGTVDVSVTYQGKSGKIPVTIYSYGANTAIKVTGYAQSKNYSEYKANSGPDSQFKIENKPYVIGTLNDFVNFPVIYGQDNDKLDGNGNPTIETIYKFESEVSISQKEGDGYTPLTQVLETASNEDGQEIETGVARYYRKESGETEGQLIATVDTTLGRFRFTDTAGDHQYRIVQKPTNKTYVDIGAIKGNSVTTDVSVLAGGYNVYNQTDLSVVDNRDGVQSNIPQGANIWTDFKETNGIPTDIEVKAALLQQNIDMSLDKLPEDFLD
ncbi:MAG: bacterial Ig-like domain-containing protein, partial [Firmicutes bacterium]|nr:bacterial Ig-like domain-containing protein [Bacillota bacterium]